MIFTKMHSIESRDAEGPEKYTVCRHVLASFSLEILQTGAVKVLIQATLARHFTDTILLIPCDNKHAKHELKQVRT